MAILNPRNDSFWFEFPQTFFYKEVEQTWNPLLKHYKLPYENVRDYMNSTIQSISFPEFNMAETPTQTRKYGEQQAHKSGQPAKNMIEREITVSFKNVEAYLNYFIMYHQMSKYLEFKGNKDNQFFDNFQIGLLDHNGNAFFSLVMEQVIFTGLTNLELSKSANTADFATFDATFRYNFPKMVLNTGMNRVM